MGSLCCCFHARDVEETAHSNGSNNRNFLDNFLKKKYEALFAREEVHTTASSDQGASSSNSLAPVNNSLTDITRTNGLSQPQNNVVIRGHDKDTDHLRMGPEPPEGRICQLTPNLFSGRRKPNGSHCEGGSEECGSQSSEKDDLSPTVVETCAAYFSSEDEDDCPTCLEEYTPENPKIMTKCSHHYHLSCILEWMKRSETCPVCGKVLEFDETT